MSNDKTPEPADVIQALCETHGLGRAYQLFPDIVTAAFARGRRPIGSFPPGFSPLTEPASRFSAEPESEPESGE
jgi:hypothetical protein